MAENASHIDRKPLLELLVAIAALAVAIVSLGFSLRNDASTRELQVNQLALERIQAKDATEPALSVRPVEYENKRGVVLHNRGKGRAVITHIRFSRPGRDSTAHLYKLIDNKVPFDTWRGFPSKKKYSVPPGEQIEVVMLTAANAYDFLVGRGASSEEARRQAQAVLAEFAIQLSDISVEVEYEDGAGTAMLPIMRSFGDVADGEEDEAEE